MNKVRNFLKNMSDTNMLLSVTIIMFALMYVFAIVAYPDTFTNPNNLFNSMNTSAPKIIVCISLSIVMITGSIDISVGGLMALVTTICGLYLNENHGNIWMALIIALAVGIAFGVVQGFLISYLEIQPFIVTLAGMFFARGLATIISSRQFNVVNDALTKLKEFAIDMPFGYTVENRHKSMFHPSQVQIQLIIAILVVVAVFIVLRWTKAGRALYAVGGNYQSAFMLGINPKKTKFMAHVASSGLAGLAGFALLISQANVNANNAQAFEMDAIAASIIGGTLLTGGVGNVIGTFFGAMFVVTVKMIVNAGASGESYWTNITIGIVLCVFLVLQSIILKVRNSRKGVTT